jgi:hypothetical protein
VFVASTLLKCRQNRHTRLSRCCLSEFGCAFSYSLASSMVIQLWASGKRQQKCSERWHHSVFYQILLLGTCSLCKHGRSKEAADIFITHDSQGPPTWYLLVL